MPTCVCDLMLPMGNWIVMMLVMVLVTLMVLSLKLVANF